MAWLTKCFCRDNDQKEIDLIIEDGQTLYPVEIKQTANPDKAMAKAFNVLRTNLPANELTVAHGTIINQYPQKLWLTENLGLCRWLICKEIGRGLRLAVNQQGERVHDKQINVLTVIPNESYEAFAQALQEEMEEEAGVIFTGRVKNAWAKAKVNKRNLSTEEEALFAAIWQKINYQTRYSVKLDTPELITSCAELLADTDQYPPVQAPKIRSSKARILMSKEGVQGVQSGIGESEAQYQPNVIPDVYAYLQNRLHLSRSTLFAIGQLQPRLGSGV